MKTIFLSLATIAAFAQSPVKVTKRPAPEKALILEVVVPAPRAAVWRAFSTSEGLSTWLTPGAQSPICEEAASGPRIFPAERPAAALSLVSFPNARW